MECGRLNNGLLWTAYTDALNQENANYFLDYPERDQDDDVKLQDMDEVNLCYENPLFIPRVGSMSEDGRRKSDYESGNEEAGEPVVYLSTSRAAKLQRALKNAGYKKVYFLLFNLNLASF